MGVKEIPVMYEHSCDCCGKIERTPANFRPKYWSNLHISQDAYDFQGNAVADGSIRRLLCGECKDIIITAINTATEHVEKHSDKPRTD